MRLTDSACRGFKPKAKPYKKTDGGGLFLLVKPNGQKYWRKKYSYLGKEKLLALGVYPLVSLADARAGRDKALLAIQRGEDPAEVKKSTKTTAIRNASNTFKAVALDWYETHKGNWSTGHAEIVLGRLERDIFPTLGNLPISSITAPVLLEALQKIEKRGALDLARRCRQICGQVFTYGIEVGKCDLNPAVFLRRSIKTRKAKHFAAIDANEIPALVGAIERNDARLYIWTRNALHLHLLTFVRPGELRNAKWEEIDFDKAQWVIPAEKMKLGKEHIVPLSRQALAILRDQFIQTGALPGGYVFPSNINLHKPMSDATERMALKRLGFDGKMTAHGFRSLAQTTISEALPQYTVDHIELQLAHTIPGALGETYNRAKYLPQRRQMMQDWADHIDLLCLPKAPTTQSRRKGK